MSLSPAMNSLKLQVKNNSINKQTCIISIKYVGYLYTEIYKTLLRKLRPKNKDVP